VHAALAGGGRADASGQAAGTLAAAGQRKG
jgi:hypothetical protein